MIDTLSVKNIMTVRQASIIIDFIISIPYIKVLFEYFRKGTCLTVSQLVNGLKSIPNTILVSFPDERYILAY